MPDNPSQPNLADGNALQQNQPQKSKPVFYNVMPEATIKPPIITKEIQAGKIAPAINKISKNSSEQIIVKSPSQQPIGISMPKLKRNKMFWIIPLVVLILGAAAGGYYWLANKNDSEPQKSEVVIEEPIPSPTSANPDVSTPSNWLAQYFGSEVCVTITECGDKADPDSDGLNNKEEYDTATDPKTPDSDQDGLADGDEMKIFKSSPLLAKTYAADQYSDADFAKGGYNITTNQPFASERLSEIKNLIQTLDLHEPTITTLGDSASSIYEYRNSGNSTLQPLPSGIEMTPQAKLDRDTQRQSTIKKIGSALLVYKESKKTFPAGGDFISMSDLIRPYNTVATNYNDPIGVNQFVYGYQTSNEDRDFILTYYSETQNQLIKYKSADAETARAKEKTQNADEQRKADIESIRSALMVYSSTKVEPGTGIDFVFPQADKLQEELSKFITTIPKDPITKQAYAYQVGALFDTFTLKATLQTPAAGTTGYMCNQLECKNY